MKGKVIDMTVPGHIDTARKLALASTPDTRWGQMKAADLHALAEPEAMLWAVFTPVEDDANDVCAITGNGPTSEANAQFFVDARAIVLGLVEEIDRLKTAHRVERERAAENHMTTALHAQFDAIERGDYGPGTAGES